MSLRRKLIVFLIFVLFLVVFALAGYTLYLNMVQHKYREKKVTLYSTKNDALGQHDFVISGSASLNYSALPRYVKHKNDVVIVSLTESDDYYLGKDGMAASYIDLDRQVKGNIYQKAKYFLRRLFQGVYFSSNLDLLSEKDIAEQHNYCFYKLPIVARQPLNDEAVMLIKNILLNHPGAHIHFHCEHGCGRTTGAMAVAIFFLVNDSLDDVINEMHRLGGVDLKDTSVWKKSTYNYRQLLDRYNGIKEAYNYARAIGLVKTTTFSEWKEKNLINSLNE